jgi:hypothetical protein
MRRMPLDEVTIDRLLSGTVAADDAPPGLAGVAEVLRAASKAGSAAVTPSNEAETVSAMVAAARSKSSDEVWREKPMRKLFKVKIAAAAIAGLLLVTTGLAFAGALPDAAQNGFSRVFEKAGITVPNANSEKSQQQQPQAPGANSESEEVKDAIDSTDPGLERGREVSDAASDGKSRVPDSVPVGEGSGVPDSPGSQSEGAAENGATISEEASNNHSQAGSDHGNSADHP